MSTKYNLRDQVEVNAFVIADLLTDVKKLKRQVSHLEHLYSLKSDIVKKPETMDQLVAKAIWTNVKELAKIITQLPKRR